MHGKYLQACLLICVMSVSNAQQTFQQKGKDYQARVAIRRYDPVSPNSQHTRHRHPKRPWRQGDRITKQEVIQNLANALLARKTTLDRLAEEEKAHNKEKLHEYALYQAKLAREQEQHAKNPPVRDNSAVIAYPGSLSHIDNKRIPPQMNPKMAQVGHVQQNSRNQPSRQHYPPNYRQQQYSQSFQGQTNYYAGHRK